MTTRRMTETYADELQRYGLLEWRPFWKPDNNGRRYNYMMRGILAASDPGTDHDVTAWQTDVPLSRLKVITAIGRAITHNTDDTRIGLAAADAHKAAMDKLFGEILADRGSDNA